MGSDSFLDIKKGLRKTYTAVSKTVSTFLVCSWSSIQYGESLADRSSAMQSFSNHDGLRIISALTIQLTVQRYVFVTETSTSADACSA